MSSFKRAVREHLLLRIGLCGPSGSGKTVTAMKLATVLASGKPYAVIDTERSSSKVYAGPEWKKDVGDFDMCGLAAPWTPERYIELIHEAEQSYPVIVVDSGTHEWDGEGGILQIVDAAAKKPENRGNKFTAWREGDARHAAFFRAILQCKAHIIVTFRSKQEYAQTEKDGRKVVEKLGMNPITRAGYEYELDVVGDLDIGHSVVFSKTRCRDLDGRVFTRAGADLGKILLEWANSGERADIKPEPPPQPKPAQASPPRREPPPLSTQLAATDDDLEATYKDKIAKADSANDREALAQLAAELTKVKWANKTQGDATPYGRTRLAWESVNNRLNPNPPRSTETTPGDRPHP